MEDEKIVVIAKRKRVLSKLVPTLGELGFNRVDYNGNRLVVEKTQNEDLYGKKNLHYKIIFEKNGITFLYSVPDSSSKRGRLLEVFPVLLNAIRIAEEYYEIQPSTLFAPVSGLLREVGKVVDKDVIDVSAELDGTKEKLSSLTKKYEDLVRSSEENARILLECERKRDELQRRIGEIGSMSDETMKEELFRWLKIHNGNVDLAEFSKAHNVPVKRIEEGLNLLIREGYIKKRAV